MASCISQKIRCHDAKYQREDRANDRYDDLFKQTLTLRDDWKGPTAQSLQIPAR